MERLSLSNFAFEGDNNVYVFSDGPEIVLVDTGDFADTTKDQLETQLRELGVGLGDIDRVILTHWHPNHAGLAGVIQSHIPETWFVRGWISRPR